MGSETLKIVSRQQIERNVWDSFVDNSDEAWLWHRYDLQDAIATWPGKSDLSFAILDENLGNKIIAVVPLHLIEGRIVRVFRRNILDSLGSVATRNNLGKRHRNKIWQVALERLYRLAKKYNAVEINLTLSSMAPAFCGARCPHVNPLLQRGCQNTLTQTWVVDLSQTQEEIYSNYSLLTKRELKKVQRNDYVIREASGIEDLEIYYDLHCATYHRTGVSPHPIEYFSHIFNNFEPKGLCRILFLIQNDRVVASQNTGLYKKGCIYWTGASRTQKSGGENRILFHNQIIFAKQNNFDWYETGEAFPNVKAGKLRGLNDFKKSFGGTLYPIYRGRITITKVAHFFDCYLALRGYG